MEFAQRLKKYLFGFAIGIILTGVFFKERLSVFTSWFPANVVKKTIQDSDVFLSNKAKCQLASYHLTSDDINKLLEDGEVYFSESQVKKKPYEYIIESEDNQYKYRIQLKPERSTILNIEDPNNISNCE